jgi:hypothetical protein
LDGKKAGKNSLAFSGIPELTGPATLYDAQTNGVENQGGARPGGRYRKKALVKRALGGSY